VWVARGELDKILERTLEAEAQTSARPVSPPPQQMQSSGPGYDTHHDRYHRGKKPKHWLAEIFD